MVIGKLHLLSHALEVSQVEGSAQNLYLPPHIIDVIFRCNTPSGKTQDSGERVTESSPSSVSYVKRSCRVC